MDNGKWIVGAWLIGLIIGCTLTYFIIRPDHSELDALKAETATIKSEYDKSIARGDSMALVIDSMVNHQPTANEHITNAKNDLSRYHGNALLDTLRVRFLSRPK